MRELELEGGKYRIIREDNGYVAAFRYGEAWRDLTGDKLVGALVSEVEELRQITPADGCVVQQADAWQAVIALLRESGAINPRTQRNTGKETALAAVRDLVEAARQPMGDEERAETYRKGWEAGSAAQAVDLERFRSSVMTSLGLSSPNSTERETLRELLALIDSRAVDNG